MTSNVGSHIIQEDIGLINDKNRDEIMEGTKEKVMALLKQTIRPEFINRIDEIVMFTPLTLSEIENIVLLQFNILKSALHEQNIEVEIT